MNIFINVVENNLDTLYDIIFSLFICFVLQTKEEILARLSALLGSQYERIVQFAESIPGFADFSKEDQRILLQIGEKKITESFYLEYT